MSPADGQAFDDQIERLQNLLAALEGLADPAAKSAARELVQVVTGLHALGLSELLDIVAEAGSQPADTLLPRFAANPRVRGLLLLHDLHPDDLQSRAREAVKRLRPQLEARGVRVDLAGVDEGIVRIRLIPSGQSNRRPPAAELQRDIEHAVLEMAPDAADLVIEGLETTGGAQEAYVPLTSISGRSSKVSGAAVRATGD